jgi:protein-tyrosine phosphatase
VRLGDGRGATVATAWLDERARNGGADAVPLPRGAGGLWLAGKHFIGPDPEAALERVGATAVVCLNEAGELADRYPAYLRWLRANAPERARWFPVPDLHAPPLEAALELVADLRARVDAGQVLLMHCGAGIGRAGTMAAALLMSMGVARADAVATVAAHRPMAGPEAGAQVDLLEALAAAL